MCAVWTGCGSRDETDHEHAFKDQHLQATHQRAMFKFRAARLAITPVLTGTFVWFVRLHFYYVRSKLFFRNWILSFMNKDHTEEIFSVICNSILFEWKWFLVSLHSESRNRRGNPNKLLIPALTLFSNQSKRIAWQLQDKYFSNIKSKCLAGGFQCSQWHIGMEKVQPSLRVTFFLQCRLYLLSLFP